MNVEVTAGDPLGVGADLVAAAGARAAQLGAPQRALADADPVAVTYPSDGAPLAVVALEPGADGLRTAAARAVRACRGGGTVAWALDPSLPLSVDEQVRALAEGAVIGGYDRRRWRGAGPPAGVQRFVICGAGEDLAAVADRAVLGARWINIARELVDAPANVVSPAGLAERATAVPGVSTEIVDAGEAGLGALAAVGASSPIEPRLIVLRHRPAHAPDAPRLALVGKAVTFDTGGYFLKPQSDIVRQKADMAGGAAVVAALGAIAELGLPLSVTGVVPACENMLSGTAIKPTDVITTAAGLTVEVTNPDAEGRLILADALWWARRDGATHVVDLATLTGAMRAGMGDVYAGVFANDDAWREPSSRRETPPVTSRGRGRCIGATDRSSNRPWPTCATPPARASGSRSSPRPSCGSSRVTDLGRMSTCSGQRCSRRTAATPSAAARPATACGCSRSSQRAWRSDVMLAGPAS